MMHKIKLTLYVEELDKPIEILGSLNDSEWDTLEAFIQYADDLLATKWVQRGAPASLQIQWRQGSGMQITTQLPEWDDVIVFLHKLRPFILQNEDTNFYRVSNLLAKLIEDSFLRSFIAEQRRIYSGRKMQEMMRISSNDVVLNSEKVLLDWLNAYEYHRDKDKKERIDDLHQMFPLDASKVIFLYLLRDKTKAIAALADMIRVILGKQRAFTTLVRAPE